MTNSAEEKRGAMDLCVRVIAMEPERSASLRYIDGTLIKSNKIKDIIPYCDQILKTESDNYMALVLKGMAMSELCRYDEAITLCRRALAVNQDCPAALNVIAKVMHAQKRFDDAISYFDKAIAAKPRVPIPHMDKAGALIDMGMLEDAGKCYNQALVKWPSSSNLLLFKSVLLMHMGKFDTAVSYLEIALDANPYNPDVLLQMSLALEKLGQIQESQKFANDASRARRLLEKSMKSGKQFLLIDGNLAPSVMMSDAERRRAAELARFEKAIASDPGCIDVLTDKWEFMQTYMDQDEVDAIMRTELDRYQKRGQISSTALMLTDGGRYVEAVTYCDDLLGMQPKLPHILLYKGDALFMLGRHEDAIMCYDRALATTSYITDAVCGRGEVLYAMGDREAAEACFDRALEIDPNDDRAQSLKRKMARTTSDDKTRRRKKRR